MALLAVECAKAEGVVPAPESAHAVRGVVREAPRADDDRESRAILIGVSGHGLFDMAAYEEYHHGTITDCTATDEQIAESPSRLPEQPDASMDR
ncbi:hypothetical protein ACIP88_16825 [Streptomyces uncialis]|uniref:hypothetical protein n=1 Tax=Streptomyces uncialis TaxID=1048205 RepID=UPI003805F796